MLFTCAWIAATLPASAGSADLGSGYAALRAKEYKKAALIFWDVVQAEPKNALAKRYFACALIGLKEPERALVELHAAQSIDGVKTTDLAIVQQAQSALKQRTVATPDKSVPEVIPASAVQTKG